MAKETLGFIEKYIKSGDYELWIKAVDRIINSTYGQLEKLRKMTEKENYKDHPSEVKRRKEVILETIRVYSEKFKE